jgi:hypothetical protein
MRFVSFDNGVLDAPEKVEQEQRRTEEIHEKPSMVCVGPC